MRLVDETEVGLEAIEDIRVRAEQRAIGVEEGLERRAPPGQLELGGDLRLRHVAGGEVGEERIELELAQRREELGAFLEIVEGVRLRREPRHPRRELVDRDVRELALRRMVAERLVERGEILHDLLVRDLHVGDADRYLGRDPVGGEALPQEPLLLDAAQRLAQVGHVRAGAQVFAREAAHPAAVGARHVGGLLARARRRDELAERAVEDDGKELVERVADLGEQPEVHAQLGDRPEGAHPGAADELVRPLHEAWELDVVELLGDAVGAGRLLGRREGGAVPGGVARPVPELSQARRLHHRLRRALPSTRHELDGCPPQPRGRRRRLRQEGESRELGEAVEHRDAELRVGAVERLPVVEEHLAQPHERVVHLAELRPLCLLVPADAADDVTAQGRRGDGEAGEADVAEALGDALEGGPPGAHDEHALVLPHEGADRIDDRLGAAGSRERLDDDGVAGRDLRDDVLLLGVRVEEEGVGLRGALVGTLHLGRPVALLDRPSRARVAGERVEERVLEIGGVRDERGGDIREGGDDETGLHVEPLEVAGEPAQAVDDRIGLEGAVLLGERHEAARVEHDAELALEGRGESGVEERLAAQPKLEVVPVAADGERPQEDRRAMVDALELPLGDADPELNRVDAAHRRELERLRGDRVRRLFRRAQCEVVADEARQQRRLAGDELGESTRVRGAQLDARRRAVDEVQERARAADAGELGPPSVPGRLGDVHGPEARISEAERVRRSDLGLGARGLGCGLRWFAQEVVVMIAGPPHDATLSGKGRDSGEARPVSPGRRASAGRLRGRGDRHAEGGCRIQQPVVVGDEGVELVADEQGAREVDRVEAAERGGDEAGSLSQQGGGKRYELHRPENLRHLPAPRIDDPGHCSRELGAGQLTADHALNPPLVSSEGIALALVQNELHQC